MKRIAYITAAILVVALVIVLCLHRRWTPQEHGDGTKLRIVSIAPSATEMLFALGVDDCVVGVTNRCDYPPKAKEIESIGGFGSPSVEKLLALSPDLVIATGLERSNATEALQRAGIRFLWVKTGNFSELFESLQTIGKEAGQTQRGEEVVATMKAELEAIAQTHRDIPADQRPRVFVEIWNDPVTTAGKGSFVDEIITRAGGVNVAGELDAPYPTVNPEKVIEWNPDVIVMGYMNEQVPKEALAGRIGWGSIEAVRTGNIINDILADHLLRPGPRLIQGVKALNVRLYPSLADRPNAEP